MKTTDIMAGITATLFTEVLFMANQRYNWMVWLYLPLLAWGIVTSVTSYYLTKKTCDELGATMDAIIKNIAILAIVTVLVNTTLLPSIDRLLWPSLWDVEGTLWKSIDFWSISGIWNFTDEVLFVIDLLFLIAVPTAITYAYNKYIAKAGSPFRTTIEMAKLFISISLLLFILALPLLGSTCC